EELLSLFLHRVPAGVDDAAYIKAGFLSALAKGEATCTLIDKSRATEILGTMLGGYNISTLVELLDSEELGDLAMAQLKKTLLMFDAFFDVEEKMKAGNARARSVIESWAAAE